jgi:hypothetical protein
VPKRNSLNITSPPITSPTPTFGEFFADRAVIDLIRAEKNGSPQLRLWDGKEETTGSVVQHNGHRYVPGHIDLSVLRELELPTHCRAHGTTKEILNEIYKLMTSFVGLEEKSASLVARVVLCSHLIEALLVAPTVMIVGPDTARANRLVALLRCLCRRALSLTGVTPAGFCSLASGAHFTYLIDQESLSDKLLALLDDAASPDRKIPFRGRLLDLSGVQVIRRLSGDDGSSRAILVSMIPSDQKLPAFDLDTQHRITDEFQGKLLNFRRANFAAARSLQFDTSKLSFELRELAWSLAAATSDDQQLQDEVVELLQEKDKQIRAEKWVDPSAIAVESVLVVCREDESREDFAYVSDLALIAQEILERRSGEKAAVDVGPFGKRLKLIGFTTERDAKGKKLRLTEAVRDRAHLLARNLGIADFGNDPTQAKRRQTEHNH